MKRRFGLCLLKVDVHSPSQISNRKGLDKTSVGKIRHFAKYFAKSLEQDWGDFLWFWWLPLRSAPQRKFGGFSLPEGILVNIEVWLVGN